jgi:hypothetical protein
LRKADEKALLRELGLTLHIFFRKGSKPLVGELSESDRVIKHSSLLNAELITFVKSYAVQAPDHFQ